MLTGNKNCVNIFKLSYDSKLFFENCILKYLINISMFRHPRCGNESYQTKKNQEIPTTREHRTLSVRLECMKMQFWFWSSK